jgi:hypothetical protein
MLLRIAQSKKEPHFQVARRSSQGVLKLAANFLSPRNITRVHQPQRSSALSVPTRLEFFEWLRLMELKSNEQAAAAILTRVG